MVRNSARWNALKAEYDRLQAEYNHQWTMPKFDVNYAMHIENEMRRVWRQLKEEEARA